MFFEKLSQLFCRERTQECVRSRQKRFSFYRRIKFVNEYKTIGYSVKRLPQRRKMQYQSITQILWGFHFGFALGSDVHFQTLRGKLSIFLLNYGIHIFFHIQPHSSFT